MAEFVDEFGEACERIAVRERGVDEAIRIIAIRVRQLLRGDRNGNAQDCGQENGK